MNVKLDNVTKTYIVDVDCDETDEKNMELAEKAVLQLPENKGFKMESSEESSFNKIQVMIYQGTNYNPMHR